MNPPRERSAIVAAWLEEGPDELPEWTRRAIAVDIRSIRQTRRSVWAPWRLPTLDRASVIAVAVLVLALAALAVFVVGPFAGGNVGGSPSVTPTSAAPAGLTTLPIPPMQQTFFSDRHGYTVSYPADWTNANAADGGLWSPPDWKSAGSSADPFDWFEMPSGPSLRAASAQLPLGLPNVDRWIDEYLTFSSAAGCAPPREQWELIRIDGAPGRLRDSCGEVEASVVLDGRVYLFTLFLVGDSVTNGRELFDALAATIDLRPEDAALPSPGP